MISAIVYVSNTGYTKRYAELLAKETGVPAYALRDVPSRLEGQKIIFLGWIMAGGIKGYKEAAKKFHISAVCQVGMSPPCEELNIKARQSCAIPGNVQLYYLQGGFDMAKMRGVYKLVMTMICKKLSKDLGEKPQRTPGEEATLRMATTGYDCVCVENLAEVLGWYRGLK